MLIGLVIFVAITGSNPHQLAITGGTGGIGIGVVLRYILKLNTELTNYDTLLTLSLKTSDSTLQSVIDNLSKK